jgi:peptidoglycan hydrolase-like protein with peptidoglycan-binding domain
VTPSIKLTRPDPLAQITRGIADIVEPKPSPNRVTTNKQMIQKVQVGLASLGFLQGKIDGVAGEATAKAIRNFEVYYNYKVTGAVTPELVDMLSNAGAQG